MATWRQWTIIIDLFLDPYDATRRFWLPIVSVSSHSSRFALRSSHSLAPSLAQSGINALFIATAYSGDMVSQTKWLVDAANAANVSHIVHLGADTTGALGFYTHVAWHAIVESYIKAEFEGKWTMLNPGYFTSNLYVYGGNPFFDPKTSTVSTLFPPYGVSPWIDSFDIGEVAARCLLDPARHAGKTHQLATEPLAIDQVCEILSRVVGKKINYKIVEPETLLKDAKEDAPDDFGRLAYMSCIAGMIRMTQVGCSESISPFFFSLIDRKPTHRTQWPVSQAQDQTERSLEASHRRFGLR
jgi:hypothetical protein